jgi:hypothetical protein
MFARQSSSRYLPVGDDLDREFDDVYQRIIASKGVRTDEEELALVNELVRRAEQGAFPQDGSMHIISPRADVDWASDEAMLALRPPRTRNNTLIAGGLVIAGAVLFALFSMIGGAQGGSNGSSASATATALATPGQTGTLAIEATQTAAAQATAVWAGSGIVVGTDYKQKLPPVYPETLEIDGVPFRIYPSAMEGGRWRYEKVEGTASWIGGTVINWSFGIPALGTNMQLFQGLGQAQDGEKEALLRMSGGAVRHFRLEKPVQIDRQQIEVFIQNKPGLTLVLLGDEQGAKRWLIRGTEDYSLSGYGVGPDVHLAAPSPDINQSPEASPTHPIPEP